MKDTADGGALNLVKLCVGADTIEDLADWQQHVMAERRRAGLAAEPRHVTRQWPRRADEILPQAHCDGPGQGTTDVGGSLYWVIRGTILVRQRILAFEQTQGADGIVRCGIVLDPTLMRTEGRPRKVFQGWRYLPPADAPPDLGRWRRRSDYGDARGAALPRDLEAALDALGVGAAGR
ncbi:MAG: DUF1489 domain-containing protein [Pseudomonadota bacterium]